MPKPDPSVYLPLWNEALNHELGLCIFVNDPKALRTELYAARAAAKDPTHQEIIVFLPASNDRVFLARKSVELEP